MVGVSHGVGSFLATGLLLPHFGFLPCASTAPLPLLPLRGFCALAGGVSLSDSRLLVYSCGCAGRVCAVPLGFSPMCRALPQGLQLALLSLMQVHWGVFRSLGVCPASLVTWVEFQPFLSFSMPLLLRLLAGVAGIVHPVWVLPLR